MVVCLPMPGPFRFRLAWRREEHYPIEVRPPKRVPLAGSRPPHGPPRGAAEPRGGAASGQPGSPAAGGSSPSGQHGPGERGAGSTTGTHQPRQWRPGRAGHVSRSDWAREPCAAGRVARPGAEVREGRPAGPRPDTAPWAPAGVAGPARVAPPFGATGRKRYGTPPPRSARPTGAQGPGGRSLLGCTAARIAVPEAPGGGRPQPGTLEPCVITRARRGPWSSVGPRPRVRPTASPGRHRPVRAYGRGPGSPVTRTGEARRYGR